MTSFGSLFSLLPRAHAYHLSRDCCSHFSPSPPSNLPYPVSSCPSLLEPLRWICTAVKIKATIRSWAYDTTCASRFISRLISGHQITYFILKMYQNSFTSCISPSCWCSLPMIFFLPRTLLFLHLLRANSAVSPGQHLSTRFSGRALPARGLAEVPCRTSAAALHSSLQHMSQVIVLSSVASVSSLSQSFQGKGDYGYLSTASYPKPIIMPNTKWVSKN